MGIPIIADGEPHRSIHNRTSLRTMTEWKMPIRAKVYEALGALADGRVTMIGDRRAEVISSARDKKYTVKWGEDLQHFSSTDNASRWQGTLGYPVIAVLLHLNVIGHDPAISEQLAGIPWKELNDLAKRNYDQVVEEVLVSIEAKGYDRSRIEAEADRIYDRLKDLKLKKLSAGQGR